MHLCSALGTHNQQSEYSFERNFTLITVNKKTIISFTELKAWETSSIIPRAYFSYSAKTDFGNISSLS